MSILTLLRRRRPSRRAPQHRGNRYWALTHLRDGDRALCGCNPGDILMVDPWDDFTCQACYHAHRANG